MGIEKIGRYQITGELGRGAMGVVYRALDPTIGRTVALKTMRVDTAGIEAQEMLARFRNEARAAGLLNHPNIITIYDAGEHEGLFYIAMEILEGESLQQRLKQQRVLSAEQIVSIASQVCAGLDYAHAKGVIHRDIKPANIMIEPDDTVKIMDFGIAKAGASLTTTGQVVGTPNYMSPEQVRGKPLDGRTDLFSLGVVLYEMVTGERPFTGDNVTTIVYKIVNEHPPEPRALDVTVHPGLNAVVVKALAKSPDQRYQTGAELARDLQSFKSLGTEATATTVMAESGAMAAMAAAPATGQRPVPSAKMPAAPSSARVPAAAAPAPLTSPDSTVSAPLRQVQRVTAAKARSMAPILIAVVAVLLVAGGLYLRSRRGGGEAPSVAMPQPAPASPAPGPASTAQQPATQATPEQPRSSTSQEGATAAVPEAAAAPAAETGELRVTSSPEGATVLLDGSSKVKWTTPATLSQLSLGTHTVVISQAGHKSATRKIEVEAGKRADLSAELKPVPAIFAINSTPPGANIFLDGKAAGQVTPARLTVEPGQHNVGLVLEGYKPERVMADAGAGQTLNLSPTLKPQEGGGRPLARLKRFFGGGPEEKGFVEIRTRPRGAEIWIGDMHAPVKTPTRIPINPGTYRITLRFPGFKPVTRNITVEKGKTYGIEEILERE